MKIYKWMRTTRRGDGDDDDESQFMAANVDVLRRIWR